MVLHRQRLDILRASEDFILELKFLYQIYFCNLEPKDQTYKGTTPEQMKLDDIPEIINDYRAAARNAIDAGNCTNSI